MSADVIDMRTRRPRCLPRQGTVEQSAADRETALSSVAIFSDARNAAAAALLTLRCDQRIGVDAWEALLFRLEEAIQPVIGE